MKQHQIFMLCAALSIGGGVLADLHMWISACIAWGFAFVMLIVFLL